MEAKAKRPRIRSRLVQLVYQVKIVKQPKEQYCIVKHAEERQHFFLAKRVRQVMDKAFYIAN